MADHSNDCGDDWLDEVYATLNDGKILYGLTALLFAELALVIVVWVGLLKKYQKILSKKYKVTLWVMILMQVLVPLLYLICNKIPLDDLKSNQESKDKRDILNLLFYLVVSALCDYIFFAFIIRLRGIYLLLKMENYDTFEAFYRRVRLLKVLYWVCLIVIIIFNFSFVAMATVQIYTTKEIHSMLGISQRQAIILYLAVQIGMFAFDLLMITFFLNTVFVFASIVQSQGGIKTNRYKWLAAVFSVTIMMGKF